MSLVEIIKEAAANAIGSLYNIPVSADDIAVNQTKPEFEGNYTIVLFTLVKQLKKSPDLLGNEIGTFLFSSRNGLFKSFNVIKGFLNLEVSDQYLIDFLAHLPYTF